MTDEIFDFSAIFNRIAAAFQAGEDGVGAYLAELGSVKTTALILFLMTLVLAMCLILVWYVKSGVASIQRERMLEREYRAKIDNRLDKKLAPGEETVKTNTEKPAAKTSGQSTKASWKRPATAVPNRAKTPCRLISTGKKAPLKPARRPKFPRRTFFNTSSNRKNWLP